MLCIMATLSLTRLIAMTYGQIGFIQVSEEPKPNSSRTVYIVVNFTVYHTHSSAAFKPQLIFIEIINVTL